MKNMSKKHMAGSCLLEALMAAALGMAGCGTKPSSTQDQNTPKKESSEQVADHTEVDVEAPADVPAAAGYVFESNGVTVGVDMDMAPIAKALGEPKSIFEQPSCAGQGTAYLYSYPGFEINTYPDGDVNYVAYILLKDDTVATPEGVDLSMTKSDIIAAYGEDYEEEDNKLTYKSGDMSLNFLLDGDSIVSIEYDSGVLN